MSFGKLYSYPGNPRTTSLLTVAKENGLDIEFVGIEPAKGVSTDYLKLNKLGKVPTFEGADGFVLSECIAIAVYLTSQNEKTTLLGKTKQDYASILRWMSYVNSEVLPPLGGWFRPIIGRDPYNKKNVDESQKAALKAVHTLEEHLLTHTYLVGERLSLADIFAASIIARGFQYFFDKKWREENPNVSRWYSTVWNFPSFSAVAGKLELIDEAIKNVAPKKEAAPKKDTPKKEAAPKAKKEKEVDDEEDEAPAAPKAKHPLELLPRATFVLDDWKRKYSNEETREVALPWFWENANFEEYSIWKVDYKYNDELTLTFMTANLIGGFFARLEGSRKYIFGAASVYGVANDSIIKGAFVIRGSDATPAFDVAPDFESYEFTKLDPTKPEDKEFVNDQWSWDKPLVVGEKTYEWADGKGAGGGPSEDNVTGFLVRSTATKWAKNSVLAVDAGSHLAAITRILEADFPLVSETKVKISQKGRNGNGNGNGNGYGHKNAHEDSPSPGTTNVFNSDHESSVDSPSSDVESLPETTTLESGAFAGLAFPHVSARANALHVVREHVSTYLITHPHLDHVSGFVINTAAFHNTSRPKRLAALPSTVNAIKTHIFNNILWPNLTDEDGGVGLVTFQRLQEGGNIALGEGSGRGYIEVCDGLGVRGFKVSHGHCMRGPGHVHRGSNANLPETPGIQRLSTHHDSIADAREARSLSFSHPTQSTPGTPLFAGNASEAGISRTNAASGAHQLNQCVIDSTAYFIRTEAAPQTPAREVLIFGDVEPDSLSLSPRTAHVWAEAAPKIAGGILTGIFIECSYTNAQGDAVLYGHLSPRHLIAELQVLAEMVKEARREHEREKEELRKGRKRKRASHGLLAGLDGAAESVGPRATKVRTLTHSNSHEPATTAEDDTMIDYTPSPARAATGTHTPIYQGHPSAPAAISLGSVSAGHSRALMAAAFEAPLKGMKVVIIHVKDTLADGPLVGETILKELYEGERVLAEQGKGLGCEFLISKSGASYWF
ncbi:EF1G-domain-containing protein [Pleomassaria siparia CBS 279.74]|uniref:EF1G-domain-containing protein n=1 Tax=Pleomassaria siparia CBS 279.74 TaxID=1314801 RepID=A0A6G1KRU9_9PLEO|nr:EF1G-domain-containing protein [Pleomassaria siparia CBS 279.74]